MTAVIHWFRRDLRLHDNSALNAALESGLPVVPVFIFDPAIYRGERASASRTAFLLAGLRHLQSELARRGSGLVIRHGEPVTVLRALMEQSAATALYFNADYSPYARSRDRRVAEALGVERVRSEHDLLMHPPGMVMTGEGKPLTVFTPFKRRWLELPKVLPRTAIGRFHDLGGVAQGVLPEARELGPVSLLALPAAGEAAAMARLERFAQTSLGEYKERRDLVFAQPWLEQAESTSALSPYLRLGMLSIRQAYEMAMAIGQQAEAGAQVRASVETWISELVWREFYNHILYHFPHVLTRSFRSEYDALEWRHAPEEFAAWAAGMTGYPIVDAAMRQLVQTGWMHNRARMIVASFLTKDLLLDWRLGELHFMRHLIDGDPAANNGGWQWTAGTGTDAQPYFRIFNPVSQSRKCDPDGRYIRHFVPELRDVPEQYLHAPWEMPIPPRGYPRPMIDHALARERTLAAFQAVRS